MNSKITTGVLVTAMVAMAAIPVWRKFAEPPSPPVSKPVPAASAPFAYGPVAATPPHREEDPLPARLRATAAAAKAAAEENRSAAWNELVDSFSVPEMPEALRALTSADDEASGQLRQMLVRRWAERDPFAAADWAVRFADPAIQKEALQQVTLAWSQTGLPQAVAWAQQLPDDLRPDVYLPLAYEAARTEPKTALTLAAELPPNQLVTDLIHHSAAQWAVGEPAAASEWAKKIGDETLRDEVLSAIATEWGVRDPVAAANLVLDSISQPKPRDDAIVGIVQRWAQTDPPAAVDWVRAFPEGNLRTDAVNALLMMNVAAISQVPDN